MKNTFEFIKDSKWGNTLGWIFGAISIILAIYFGAIKKEEPKLEYDIVAKTDFFNHSENVSGLKVFIDDTINVQEKHFNITTYNIQIKNKGSKHIDKSDYVEGFFGLKIDNGTLLDVPFLLSSSGGYIENTFYVDTNVKGESKIEIPKLAIDKNDKYIIKVILLHDKDSVPRFHTIGKIIGQKEIDIKEGYIENNPKKISVSSILVGILVAFIAFGINYLFDTIIDKKMAKWKGKQKEEERQRKKEEIDNLPDIMPIVKDEYLTNGYYAVALLELLYIAKDEPTITNEYRRMARYLQNNRGNTGEDYTTVKKEYDRYQSYIEKGFLVLNEDFSLSFNKEAKESVKKLLEFLREKDSKQKRSKSLNEILDTDNQKIQK